MANISIEELQNTLMKSGLPFGNSMAMNQARPGLRQQISGAVGDRGANAARQKFHQQLAQIAQMDQKLAGVYGDPSSKLYIENPMSREQAIYSPRDTLMKGVDQTINEVDTAEKARENEISEAEQLYKELEAAQRDIEQEEEKVKRETKKAGTAAKKAATVKATTVKDKKGNTVFELSKQQARQVKNSKINSQDAKAISEFMNNSPAEFRKYLEDQGINGKIKGQLTANEIKTIRTKWEKEQAKAKEKKKAETKKGRISF